MATFTGKTAADFNAFAAATQKALKPIAGTSPAEPIELGTSFAANDTLKFNPHLTPLVMRGQVIDFTKLPANKRALHLYQDSTGVRLVFACSKLSGQGAIKLVSGKVWLS